MKYVLMKSATNILRLMETIEHDEGVGGRI
jgi:hypothetical protein